MRNALAVLVLILLLATPTGATAAGSDAPVVFDADRAVVRAAPAGRSLSRGEPGATADATAAAFLRANGRDAATADSLVLTNSFAIHGVTHLRFGQQVGGLRIAGAYARAAVDARGRLLHVVDNLVPVRVPSCAVPWRPNRHSMLPSPASTRRRLSGRGSLVARPT